MAPGGRPIPGTRRAEFVQVATGRLGPARPDAANALYALLAAEMPEARLEALLDGGPTAEPGPGLRMPISGVVALRDTNGRRAAHGWRNG